MENEIQKVICCPVCGSAENHFFCKKNGFNMQKCFSCDLIFVYPLPNETAGLYAQDYFNGAGKGFGYVDYDGDKGPMIPAFNHYLSLLSAFYPQKGKLLDIGAATGFFMDLAKTRGWDVSGVEISDYAAGRGRDKGLNIKTGTLGSVSFPDESFDVITLFDVIEHVRDPKVEITILKRLLKKDGLLLFNTPDAGSLFAKVLGKKWHLLVPPEHLHLFNVKNLTKLLSDNNFTIVKTGKHGKRFTLQYILKTLYMWQKLVFWKKGAEFLQNSKLNSLSIPINLRDNFFCIAKKQ